ncbi:putative late blight resistance protein homolog R1B-8 [Salvia splendens]|uniref:putative late blight resistance protein homolog R1B-8 n=1 Tax=Salvia splendens TaxID=180675 RepID=UPI001C2526E5|nr:putative late blight resistance protein homolog R1B-8 [Salvia splendens]
MGVFDEDHTVRVSTLVKLWVSEGLLRPISGKSMETSAKEYLIELVDRNLILVHELRSTGCIKYCKVHDLLRDFCCREAGKDGFYHVIWQHKSQGSNRQRCVIIPRGTTKDEACEALRSVPLARSLVCHSLEVVPMPESKLLRTLKAYDRDRYGTHEYLLDDLFQFVNSRYLAVGVQFVGRMYGIPSSVSFLWNLHTLIIFHSTNFVASSFWMMPQLRHFESYKGALHLQRPPNGNVVIMYELQTLKGVDLWNLDWHLSFPNIKKLAIHSGEFQNLESMNTLESYTNWWQVKGNTFPHYLKKLSLGSHHSNWDVNEEMLKNIGALPLLQKLKLERAHFQKGVWETSEEQFPRRVGNVWDAINSLGILQRISRGVCQDNSRGPR